MKRGTRGIRGRATGERGRNGPIGAFVNDGTGHQSYEGARLRRNVRGPDYSLSQSWFRETYLGCSYHSGSYSNIKSNVRGFRGNFRGRSRGNGGHYSSSFGTAQNKAFYPCVNSNMRNYGESTPSDYGSKFFNGAFIYSKFNPSYLG